jgi:hypothetical protein
MAAVSSGEAQPIKSFRAARLGIAPVGSGTPLTFRGGELRLSEWLAEIAFLTWEVRPEPWLLEEDPIRNIPLPLNLDQNGGHPFHSALTAIRSVWRCPH